MCKKCEDKNGFKSVVKLHDVSEETLKRQRAFSDYLKELIEESDNLPEDLNKFNKWSVEFNEFGNSENEFLGVYSFEVRTYGMKIKGKLIGVYPDSDERAYKLKLISKLIGGKSVHDVDVDTAEEAIKQMIRLTKEL